MAEAELVVATVLVSRISVYSMNQLKELFFMEVLTDMINLSMN